MGAPDGHKFVRDEATQLREIEALRLRATGMTLEKIAVAVGWANKSSAKRAIDRILADVKFDAVDDYRRLELTRLEGVAAKMADILTANHPFVRDGVVVKGVHDVGPNIAAARELRQISARIATLLGLDAPSRRIVEVITEDVIDAELRALAAELTELDRGDATV